MIPQIMIGLSWDLLEIDGLPGQIVQRSVLIHNRTKGISFSVRLELSDTEVDVLLVGGRLAYLKQQSGQKD